MEVQSQFGNDVRIIGIPGLSDVEAMERFVDRTGSESIEHIPDVDGALWERFGVNQHRAYVLVDEDGITQTIGYGALSEDVGAFIAG